MKITAEKRNSVFNLLLIGGAVYLGSKVMRKLTDTFGITTSKEELQAREFRTRAALNPQYYKDVLKVGNTYDAVKLIYTKDDISKLKEVEKAILNFYESKGIFVDDEEKAINWLQQTIKSKIDLSIFADMFENYAVLSVILPLFGVYPTEVGKTPTKQNFLNYLDSFLEDRYQTRLDEWYATLPILTTKQQENYRNATAPK